MMTIESLVSSKLHSSQPCFFWDAIQNREIGGNDGNYILCLFKKGFPMQKIVHVELNIRKKKLYSAFSI